MNPACIPHDLPCCIALFFSIGILGNIAPTKSRSSPRVHGYISSPLDAFAEEDASSKRTPLQTELLFVNTHVCFVRSPRFYVSLPPPNVSRRGFGVRRCGTIYCSRTDWFAITVCSRRYIAVLWSYHIVVHSSLLYEPFSSVYIACHPPPCRSSAHTIVFCARSRARAAGRAPR